MTRLVFICAGIALALAGCAGPSTRAPAPVETRTADPRVPAPAPVPVPRTERKGDAEIRVVPLGEPEPMAPRALPPRPVTVERAPASVNNVTGATPSAVPRATPGPLVSVAPAPTTSPAIDDLLRDVRRHWADGRHEMAAASLERALRIEPRNAYLWQHLAALRLEQGRADLAEQFAAKSNSYAGSSAPLRLRNWRIIAAARRHAVNPRGAREAERRAAEYERAGR